MNAKSRCRVCVYCACLWFVPTYASAHINQAEHICGHLKNNSIITICPKQFSQFAVGELSFSFGIDYILLELPFFCLKIFQAHISGKMEYTHYLLMMSFSDGLLQEHFFSPVTLIWDDPIIYMYSKTFHIFQSHVKWNTYNFHTLSASSPDLCLLKYSIYSRSRPK